jgi:hypothetical protein
MKKTAATLAALCVAFSTSSSADTPKSAVNPDAGKFNAASQEPAAKQSEKQAKWPEYRGRWFKVNYPPGWKAQPLEAKTAKDSDAATFTSPNGAMQFYIFSPQWGGDAPGIALDPAKEVEHERKSAAGKSSDVAGTFTWIGIEAKDKSYLRNYQSFKAKDASIHWVVGFKARSDAVLKQYRTDYERFKKSLEQYAD